ncbi:hypothetical protein DM01DRAFT_1225415 [Hesseltinella vesiculosa]|uniref:Uncharacterized protein n=1 Tax=Hesseltinella vesiculosa TaxID=101127 RepID=A0A1X2GMM9_9FUNG|nr:hypothetical protein DM01DRAFT_1225415 [Hesseltinella vesiculosa]
MAHPSEHASSYLNLSISTVDYKRKDPVFWIVAKTNISQYKQPERRFPRYYSELVKLGRHLDAHLDDVLLAVLPACPQPHHDKEGKMVPRQWWLHIIYTQDDTARSQTTSPCHDPSFSQPDDDDQPIAHDHRHSSSHLNPRQVWDMRIQLWLERLADHPRIHLNQGLQDFIESEVGFRPFLPPARRQKKISGFHHLHQDMDAEFLANVDQLEQFTQALLDVSQRLVEIKTAMALWSDTWIDLTSSLIAFGAVERHPGLFLTYKQLAKETQKLGDIEHSVELLLSETLGEEVDYQIRNVVSAKSSMERRMKAFSKYMDSHRRTESSLRHVERLKSSSNIDRQQVTEVIADLEQVRWEQKATASDPSLTLGTVR